MFWERQQYILTVIETVISIKRKQEEEYAQILKRKTEKLYKKKKEEDENIGIEVDKVSEKSDDKETEIQKALREMQEQKELEEKRLSMMRKLPTQNMVSFFDIQPTFKKHSYERKQKQEGEEEEETYCSDDNTEILAMSP